MSLNIMTQDGETDGYDADDHVRAILEHAGPGVIDVCIANSTPVPPEIMEPYRKRGRGPARAEPRRISSSWALPCARSRCWSRDGISATIPTRSRARSCRVWQEFRNEITTERNGAVMSFSSNVKAGAVPPAHQPPAGGRGRAVRHIALLQRLYRRELIRITTEIAGSGRAAAAADEEGLRLFLRSGAGRGGEPGSCSSRSNSQEKIHKIFAPVRPVRGGQRCDAARQLRDAGRG